MTTLQLRLIIWCLIGMACAQVSVGPQARAALRTWDGGGTNNLWLNPTNWVGDVAPVAGDDLVFPMGAARLLNVNNFPAGTTFNAITISGTNYDVQGALIALNAGINAANTTVENYWSIPVSLNSSQTITTGNAFVNFYFSGSVNLNDKDLTFAGSGFAQVSDVISGTGGLIKSGSGSALLYASNTFSGGVQLLQGIVAVWNDSALGTTNGNTTVAAGATLQLADPRTIAEPLALAGTLNSAGAGAKVWMGTISLTDPNATIQVGPTAPMSVNGVVSGSGGFTKTATGLLILNANNTYMGSTTLSFGNLQVNGSQPGSPIVIAGGLLSGTGTVGTITSSGATAKTNSPGANGPGILNSSNVTFNSTTTFVVDLNGTNVSSGYDQLKVTGTVALDNAVLLVTSSNLALTGNESFVIINNDGGDAVGGTFNGLAEGALVSTGTNSLKISYVGGSGNDVVLSGTNVPPLPACLMLWTNRYTGPGSFGGEDYARTIAVDDSGNVFVTGSSLNDDTGFDYATVAYSSVGVPLWTNRYDGAFNGDDVVYGMAVGNGGVFVTGSSETSSQGNDYVTVAYSISGVPLWTNRYNGPGNNDDFARAVAVDNSGHVVVTGISYSGNTALTADYATVAYSSTGAPLWTNRYNGDANAGDSANAVAVDPSGNVFVTGFARVTGGNPAYGTVAYSSAGVPLWTNHYNGPGNIYDEANAVAVDQTGNVFVTGYSTGTNGLSDYATVAYSSAGVPLWTNRYNGPGNSDDEAKSLAVDGSGNVFVTGESWGGASDFDYATVAYSASGVPLWTNRYNGPGNYLDSAVAVAVDHAGNVFVTGFSEGNGSAFDYATLAYSNAGVPLWTNRCGVTGGSDGGGALAVDSSGFVYVTGQLTSLAGGVAYGTVKYPPSTSPYLSIQASGGQLVLNWLNPCYSLQSAPDITGAFTNVLGATNPHTNSVINGQLYYRLKKN